MRRLLIGFVLLIGFAHGQCVEDYTIYADSTPVQVSFLPGLIDRWCFDDPCDSSLRHGEITVRVKSDSLSNTLVLSGFQGDIGVTVMDTNCGLVLLNECLMDLGPPDTTAFTYILGRNFIAGITAHMQQLPGATVAAFKTPQAPPPPIVEVCPVGVAEWTGSKPRCKGAATYANFMGQSLPCPPRSGMYWDGSKCAWVWAGYSR